MNVKFVLNHHEAFARQALVSRIPDRQWLDAMPGERIAFRVRSGDVGGAYTVFESIAAPMSGTPMHVHSNEDEIFQIVEGCLRFCCDETEFDAPAGTSVVIPRNVAHAWRNLGETRALSLVTFTPGGIDGLFEQMATGSAARVLEIATLYGSFVVGPMIGE